MHGDVPWAAANSAPIRLAGGGEPVSARSGILDGVLWEARRSLEVDLPGGEATHGVWVAEAMTSVRTGAEMRPRPMTMRRRLFVISPMSGREMKTCIPRRQGAADWRTNDAFGVQTVDGLIEDEDVRVSQEGGSDVDIPKAEPLDPLATSGIRS